MANENLPDFITALQQAEAYDHPASDIALVQTHISFVLLAGDYVYKFKKPVDFGFLDFSTLAKRKHCCEQELLLNRRLCPDIYLGLVSITRQESGFAINGSGEAVEYGVQMKRMPEEQMMINLIRQDKVAEEEINSLVDKLVPFYKNSEHNEEIDSYGRAESVAVNVLENFEQTEGFVGQGAIDRDRFDRIVAWSKEFLSREDLFTARIQGGYIRDCHGDLYSANICLADKVYIYDCIEFNRRFRYCDVASDIAFLAMDLDFHGLKDLSEYCITEFCGKSGDETLPEMLDFYKCYRAYVRGKIGLFTASDPAVDKAVKKRCLEGAEKYFALAEGYTR
jgi:aminoglycoside phosphotransferase family enzyme